MKIVELKKKIPKILIIPVLILFVFSIYSAINKLEEKARYTNAHDYMHFTIIASDLIHELQKERGYSSGYISSKGKSFLKKLKIQRVDSDKKIKYLKLFLKNFDSSVYDFPFKKPTEQVLTSLDEIDIYRDNIDKLLLNDNIDYYTNNINILLALIEQIVTISNDSKLVILMQSYIIFTQIKETAGLERALINKVFGEGILTNEEFYRFGALVSAQEIYMKHFKSITKEEYTDKVTKIINKDAFDRIDKERDVVYAKNQKNKILSCIKEYVGYGGLIHNFKNYVIRGKERYKVGVKKQYALLIKAINKYKAIDGVTKEEIGRLDIIKNTFLEYMNGLPKIIKSYQNGGTISALDKIVKVNDKPAIKALHDLTTHIYGSQQNWFKQATKRINILKEVENEIALNIDTYIYDRNMFLFIGLIIQVVILFIIIVVIISSVAMLRELIESGKMLNRAQENTRSGSYEYFFEDDILFWSEEHYKLLQLDKKIFKPSMKSFREFVYPEDMDSIEKTQRLAISSKKIAFVEYRIILQDNSILYVRSSYEIIKYSKKGKPLIMVGTITDISKSRELEEEIINTQKDVIFTMGAIGETRSKETGLHVKRVAEYSKLLYLLSGANNEEAELLKMASPMHDIGKVGIPDNILHKPGKLTPTEWAIMKTHSEMGYDMLKNSHREILQLAATVALTHHERYDGAGYPRGLIANEIPLVGRITALADVFDALGSDRCYKTAWELKKIVELIKNERAKQFDPVLVDIFLENLDKFLDIRDRYKDKF